MDPVLTPILIGAGVSGTAFTVGTTAVSTASLLSAVIVTAATIGGTYALQELQEDDKNKRTSEQFTVKQSIPNRVRGYGTVKLGGALFFTDVSPSVTLTQGIMHCEGPISYVREWWLNDKKAAIAPGATGVQPAGMQPYFALVKVETHLGSTTQAADATLLANFSSTWTSDHRLLGIAYSVISYGLPPNPQTNLRTTYPSGAPQLRIVADMVAVYDPRNTGHDPNNSSTWAWSDNPALCILDFLTHARGMNLPLSRMNLGSFSDFADFCDEEVAVVVGGATTEKRWRLSGVYNFNEESRVVMRRMLVACDGELKVYPDGTIGIVSSTLPETPSVTISDENILQYEYQQENDKLAKFNRLKFTYLAPEHDYQQVEGDPWDNAEDQAATGQIVAQEVSLSMVPSHSQARRIAKIIMGRENPQHRFMNLVVTLPALDLLGERQVQLSLSDLGISGVFRIARYAIADDLTTVTMDLVSIDGNPYTWTVSEQGNEPGGVGTPIIVPVPTQDRIMEDGQLRWLEDTQVRSTE